MRGWIAITLVWIAAAGPAAGQDSEPDMEAFQGHLDAALAHYEARQYAEAAADFRLAYEIRAEPDLMYNIARSYERALMRQEAIAAYDEFVALPGTTSEMRSRALEARNNLRAEVAALRAGEPEPEPQPEPDPEPEPEPDVEAERVTEPVEPPPTSLLRRAGWALLGGGAGVIVAGAIFGGLAIRANNEFGDTTVRSEQEELQDEVQRNALAADILVGVGAAAAVAGVLLVWLGKPETDDTHVSVRPVIGPSELGLTIGGRL